MVITISGSQGQGKSTVIKSLEELGYTSEPQKTSRSILSDWGYTLNEINKYPPLTAKFQDEIVNRQYEKDLKNLQSSNLIFTERSYADIFTYAMFAIGSFNEYDEYMDEYFELCKERQQVYEKVIYLTGRDNYKPEEDNVRSVNMHFAKSVDALNLMYTKEFTKPENLIVIDEADHDKRIEMILEALGDKILL